MTAARVRFHASRGTTVMATDVPVPEAALIPQLTLSADELQAHRGAGRFDRAAKRALDVVVSAVLLLVLAPLLALIAIVIVLDDPGPIFYVCTRAGYRGRPLRLAKFRKMHRAPAGAPLTIAEDPRFTRVGRVLAATKLDELPQLWSVFIGRMSLVGPRPEDPQFVALHEQEYGRILTTRPGITGLSQLAFTREAAVLDPVDPIGHYVNQLLPQKVRIDLLYVETRTMVMDLKVLGWTLLTLLLGCAVAVNRDTGRLGIRHRSAQTGRTEGDQ
jgi:lipopolysaccharide/colanic/teichoic acid biosynthesis glycosyltransferase